MSALLTPVVVVPQTILLKKKLCDVSSVNADPGCDPVWMPVRLLPEQTFAIEVLYCVVEMLAFTPLFQTENPPELFRLQRFPSNTSWVSPCSMKMPKRTLSW